MYMIYDCLNFTEDKRYKPRIFSGHVLTQDRSRTEQIVCSALNHDDVAFLGYAGSRINKINKTFQNKSGPGNGLNVERQGIEIYRRFYYPMYEYILKS